MSNETEGVLGTLPIANMQRSKPMDTSAEKPVNMNTTLYGGVDTVALKQDGSSEPVKILQLPIDKYGELLGCIDNEAAMIELFCDRPKGWARTLTLEECERIVIAGEEINSDFFSRWARRRLQRQEKLMPGLADKIANLAVSQNSSSPSPSSTK